MGWPRKALHYPAVRVKGLAKTPAATGAAAVTAAKQVTADTPAIAEEGRSQMRDHAAQHLRLATAACGLAAETCGLNQDGLAKLLATTG